MNYLEYARSVLLERPWVEFGLPSSGRILDVGCGSGWVQASLEAQGLRVESLDLRRNCASMVQGDATQLPYRDESFDGATCLRTLQHIPDAARGLSEIRRVLRRGGPLLVAVSNKFSYTLAVGRRSSRIWSANPNDPHYTPSSIVGLRRALHGAGFSQVRTRTCHFLPILFAHMPGGSLSQLLAASDTWLGSHPPMSLIGPLVVATGRRA